ncbi:MAG TPA: hypothetical protein VJJ22_02115 [Candidatus Paceibacterota bacterium]
MSKPWIFLSIIITLFLGMLAGFGLVFLMFPTSTVTLGRLLVGLLIVMVPCCFVMFCLSSLFGETRSQKRLLESSQKKLAVWERYNELALSHISAYERPLQIKADGIFDQEQNQVNLQARTWRGVLLSRFEELVVITLQIMPQSPEWRIRTRLNEYRSTIGKR